MGERVKDVGEKLTGSDGSSHHDGASTIAEELQSSLSLALRAITMDCGGGEALIDQEIGQGVGHALGLDEDESEPTRMGVQDIEKDRALVVILDVLDLLGDVLGG